MIQRGDVRRNSLFALVSQVTRLATNAVAFIGIARIFGPVEFGQFTAAHTLSVVFLLIADFGFDRLLVWEVARNVNIRSEVADRYFTAKLIYGAVVIAIMAVVAGTQYATPQTRLLALVMTVYTLVCTLTNFFFALFRGVEEFQHETRISLISNVLLLGAVLCLWITRAPIIAFAIAFVLTRFVALSLAFRVSRTRFSLPRFRFSLPSRNSATLILVFGLNQLFSALFFTQDTLLLAMWRGDYDVGIYQSVFKIIAFLFVVPDVLFQAFLPTLSRLSVDDRARWDELGRVMNKTLFFIGLPLATVISLYPEVIISVVYGGKSFAEAIPILRIFAGVTVLHFFGVTNAIVLISTNRVRVLTSIVFFATVLNLAMNAYLIPHYGPTGAAWASLSTMLFVATAYVVATREVSLRWVRDARYLIPLWITLAGYPVLWVTRDALGWGPVVPFLLLLAVVSVRFGYSDEERRLLLDTSNLPFPIRRLFP
jgi:O-antigen/teichoic acid export membrane protein